MTRQQRLTHLAIMHRCYADNSPEADTVTLESGRQLQVNLRTYHTSMAALYTNRIEQC